MPGRYPVVDIRGFVVGTLTVNDDTIPEAITRGVEFRLGGSWVDGPGGDFLSFIIVPADDLRGRRH
jgi:hypothetical protein